MGDILSTVLSAFSKEPIFVLAIIFFVVSSILKSSKSDEEEQEHSHETTTGGMTWEEMERAYGIKMEQNQQEKPAVTDASTAPSEVDAYHTTEVIKPKKKKKAKKSAEPTLQERLATYNRESAAALQMVELAQSEDEHATKVEKKEKKQRQPISVKEGMRWSIILDKPKALHMRSR